MIKNLLLTAATAVAILSQPALAEPNTKADIVDVAVKADSFKTLVAAVKAAGLVDVLKGDGPFTVFAPTDEAFKKLPEGTVESPQTREQRQTCLHPQVSRDPSEGHGQGCEVRQSQNSAGQGSKHQRQRVGCEGGQCQGDQNRCGCLQRGHSRDRPGHPSKALIASCLFRVASTRPMGGCFFLFPIKEP